MEPLVSVVIPTYKGIEAIEKTVRSIEKQSYKNIQIIVVDDNGIGTKEQLETEKIIKQFPNVEYYKHEVNQNGSAARNTGMSYAKGKYIAFLDDDDTWCRDKIVRQVNKMETLDESWGLIYGPYIDVDDNDGCVIISDGLEGKVLYEFIVEDIHIASSVMMIRRSVLDKVIGFDESFHRHQDWEFICRIAYEYKIAYEPNAYTLKYLKHRNSPKSAEKIEKNRLYYLEKMEPIIASLGKDKAQKVYNYHYTFIAKEYLRRKQFMKCICWLGKTSNPIRSASILLKDVIKNIVHRLQKKQNLNTVLHEKDLL